MKSRNSILVASTNDWPGIVALLSANQLPVSDLDAQRAAEFLVAKDERGLAGCIGCERRGAFALFRSLAVRDDCRGRGIGKRLTAEMERKCKSAGVEAAYILTETAAKFAESQGYRVVERLAVPGEIRSTRQFNGLCPCCAICMAKTL